MAPLVALAIQAIPSILDMFDAPESVKRVSEDVANVALAVTGTKTADEAAKVLSQDPNKYAEFKLALEDKKIQWEQMYLQDTQSARLRDVEMRKSGYVNTRANWMLISAYAGVAFCFFAIFKSDLGEYEQSVLTLILGRMLGYIDQGFNFEFGTTRTSRNKDDTISELSKG